MHRGGSGQVQKTSPTPGFDPRTVQPVASLYTHYSIPKKRMMWTGGKGGITQVADALQSSALHGFHQAPSEGGYFRSNKKFENEITIAR